MAVAFGRYELLKKIAAGGMGQVFLARTGTAGFEKVLVIKRILPSLGEDEEFVEMFFDEARIAARLNHPNLVQIFDVGEVDGVPYLAMEYLRGEDLRRVEKAARQAGKPVPLGLLVRIIADAAAGLAYAHGARDAQGKPMGLVHRDVSPQNILVGFDGAVKLIDFGVAKAAGRSQRTASGILKGKYAYMSPEQADGRPLDGRSDLFALGIILWEVLTGRRLFKGENDLETLRLVKECQVPPPSRLNPEVTPELEAIVLRCLMPRVEDRFPDAGALRLALEDYLVRHGLPASAAHLADFLKPLYAARIEREAHPESMDELSESVDLDARSASESKSQRKQFSVRHLATPEPRPPARATRSPGALVAAGAAAVLVLGGGLFAWSQRGQPAPGPAISAPAPAAPALPPPPAVVVVAAAAVPVPAAVPVQPPAPPAPPAPVTVQVESNPSGATVSSGGEELGTTPLALDLMRAGSPRALEFKLAGHEPVVATVSAQNAPMLRVELPVRREPRRPAPPPPDLGIKTGR
jgi:serine/threonine protein kinase